MASVPFLIARKQSEFHFVFSNNGTPTGCFFSVNMCCSLQLVFTIFFPETDTVSHLLILQKTAKLSCFLDTKSPDLATAPQPYGNYIFWGKF